MQRKIITITTILIIAFATLFWLMPRKIDAPETAKPKKPKIAATIFPLYDIVKQVGGDKIDAVLVLAPGTSPHTFEASPAQIKEINGAEYFFTIGAGADDWAKNIAEALTEAQIVNLDQFISLQPFEHQANESQNETDEHTEDGFDPHYWLDPDNAKIMAREIANKLIALDPSNSDYYQNNFQIFANRLDEKDKEWQEKIESLTNKNLVIFHDAWGYFAKHFSLNIVASFEPFPGKTPSPQYIIDLENAIKENNIKTLFTEPQLSNTAITTLASDLNVKTDILDPLGGVEQRDNYIDLMDFNLKNVYQALK